VAASVTGSGARERGLTLLHRFVRADIEAVPLASLRPTCDQLGICGVDNRAWCCDKRAVTVGLDLLWGPHAME
jgi:hypothetical protein